MERVQIPHKAIRALRRSAEQVINTYVELLRQAKGQYSTGETEATLLIDERLWVTWRVFVITHFDDTARQHHPRSTLHYFSQLSRGVGAPLNHLQRKGQDRISVPRQSLVNIWPSTGRCSTRRSA